MKIISSMAKLAINSKEIKYKVVVFELLIMSHNVKVGETF